MKFFWILSAALLITACAESDMDRRQTSTNFKNGQFENNTDTKTMTFWEIAWAGLTSDTERAEWPETVDVKEDTAPAKRVEGDQVRITLVNHATFLIQTQGLNILTDPVFSERASPLSFVGPKRAHKPGIALENLPQIDVIVISHDHYDHLDLDSLTFLITRDNPKIYVGLGVAKRLPSSLNTLELDWGESTQINDEFTLWFLEVQHNSGRTPFDRNSTLWGGFMMQIGQQKIYFGGDSGYANHYKHAYEQFGAVDIAFIPIGAYAPREIFKPVHLDPFEAVQAHLDLNAKLSIGMHYGTFQLTAESRLEPIELLEEAKQQAQVPASQFITLEVGQATDF
ncbi:membrane protein [Vibrio sp. MACH09]|uniref:MBL fold metallo-hydrolase n=1 Tax=Vibrio sp. MACH09 TaxID=3025122 RepID=UPI0027906C22|nr:MBL fold metallo-hydrolase [Vibrio sp. MACH09]GLO61949.1 membrane protein [Vibrio sp. MACH09]